MQDTDAPPRRNEGDDGEATSAETKMRLALERLGTRSSPVPGEPGGKANGRMANARATPQPRKRFVRDGEVPVVRVPSLARLPGDVGRELADERAARERAEHALADAQATIGRLQAARSRAEQALQAAQAAVEERDAAMASLRAEMAQAAQREAALTEAVRVEAGRREAEAKLTRERPKEPEPVKWWLDYLKEPRL